MNRFFFPTIMGFHRRKWMMMTDSPSAGWKNECRMFVRRRVRWNESAKTES